MLPFHLDDQHHALDTLLDTGRSLQLQQLNFCLEVEEVFKFDKFLRTHFGHQFLGLFTLVQLDLSLQLLSNEKSNTHLLPFLLAP